MELKIYPSKQEVAEGFSQYLADLIQQKESLHIALSGGSTPKVVFDLLAAEYKGLPWQRVHLYWGDERCVPPTDAESNYGMTRDHLLSKINIPEANIHRVLGEDDPQGEAKRYGDVLQGKLPTVDGVPQFDLVILGMGDDGHTASIFPHQIALWEADTNCEVATHPESGQLRVTLTGKVINNAAEVAFLVTGAGKAEKVKAIIEKTAGFEQYPAALVAPKSDQLYWFMDKDAAAQLQG